MVGIPGTLSGGELTKFGGNGRGVLENLRLGDGTLARYGCTGPLWGDRIIGGGGICLTKPGLTAAITFGCGLPREFTMFPLFKD